MNLTFRFEDLSDFLTMGGHGPYVWACYGVVALLLCFMVIEPIAQRKRFIKQQKGLLRRKANIQKEVSK